MRVVLRCLQRGIFTVLMFGIFLTLSVSDALAASDIGDMYTVGVSDFRYTEKDEYGYTISCGYFELTTGQQAFCSMHEMMAPSVGQQLTVSACYTSRNQQNEMMRKILYYGWHGPGDIGESFSTTSLAVSVANGHKDNYTNHGKRFMEVLASYPNAPEGFKVVVLKNHHSAYQDLVFWELEPADGSLKLKKHSANPELTQGNSCYSLAGAKYGVFTEPSCVHQVETLITDASGESNIVSLAPGTYYVKEIEAPKGFMVNTNIHEKTVVSGELALIIAYDGPTNDPAAIELTKIDADGNDIASLAGAQFTVKYYDGYYSSAELPVKPVRTWVLETKALKSSDGQTKYILWLADAFKVAGDPFYLENGTPTLPLGTISVEETRAPEGYVLDGGYLQVSETGEKHFGKYVTQIRQNGDIAKLFGGNKFTVSDFETRIKINKIDAETGKGLKDAGLQVKDASGKIIDTWISDGLGHEIRGLIVGQTYVLSEIKVPDGYEKAADVTFTVQDAKDIQEVVMADPQIKDPPPETNPPQTQPPETNPPQTQPPIETNPPETNPPETIPPQTTPPEETRPPEIPQTGDQDSMRRIWGQMLLSGGMILVVMSCYKKR